MQSTQKVGQSLRRCLAIGGASMVLLASSASAAIASPDRSGDDGPSRHERVAKNEHRRGDDHRGDRHEKRNHDDRGKHRGGEGE